MNKVKSKDFLASPAKYFKKAKEGTLIIKRGSSTFALVENGDKEDEKKSYLKVRVQSIMHKLEKISEEVEDKELKKKLTELSKNEFPALFNDL